MTASEWPAGSCPGPDRASAAVARKKQVSIGSLVGAADGDVQVVHQAGAQRIDPAVHREFLAAGPGILHEDVGGDVPDLALDVELAQAVEPRGAGLAGVELGAVVVGDLADRMQPVVD